MEVLALLAKREFRSALEQMLLRADDHTHEVASFRPRQKQHRLTPEEHADLLLMYTEGASVLALAKRYNVHRTTVMAHLERERIPRRPCTRRLSEEDVQQAARHYAAGESLVTVGRRYGVTARTVATEFRKAGVEIRARRGWTDQPPQAESPNRDADK